jgi:sugar/nucleoside kinase (ribokinase family)
MLANTFHALVTSTIDGQPIFDGMFQTAVGDDQAGVTFEQSFAVNDHMHRVDGYKTMVCNVVPIGGDRILITTPNGEHEAQNLVSEKLIIDSDVAQADKIMIGGFTCFTPNGFGVYDRLASIFENTQLQRPEFIMTAAAQGVVDQDHVQKQIRRIQRTANTTIHANTGEFRRLMGMDDQWRHFTEGRFENLSGHILEDAKGSDSRYQMDKDQANMDAVRHAMQFSGYLHMASARNAQYVVTNGSKATYQISNNDREKLDTAKVNKSKIVSTVGAGDNHMAGYQIGKALGLTTQNALALANKFAAAVIQSPLARLDADAETVVNGRTLRGPIAHAFL